MPRILSHPDSSLLLPWEAPPLETEQLAEPLGPAPGDLLAEARQLAAQELAEARREAEEVLEQARQRGYQEGQERAETELQERLRALEELVGAIDARQETFFARMQDEAIALSVAVAGKVIGREVEAHPDLVVEEVKRCLRRVRERERIRVRVNPADVETLRAAKESLTAAYDGIGRLDIMDDHRVGRGGCLMETVDGILDARLDRQLTEVERAMVEAAKGGNGS